MSGRFTRSKQREVAGHGELKGFWVVTVRANWRVIFRFAGRNATGVDYVDYH
jgi:plasmid maintenance system killer protein